MVTPTPAAHHAEECPFIDDEAPCCSSRFKLHHLTEVFELCAGSFRSCPHYYQLLRQPYQASIRLTRHGQPLQPTGS